MSVPPKSFAEIFNGGSWKKLQQFADGILQANDGTTFRIHRVVLSQRSEFFCGLFTHHLNPEAIVLPNIDSKILESVLVYIYTGLITLDEKNVCDMMIASDYLLLDDLFESYQSVALQNMTNTSCLPLLAVASQINRLASIETCFRYALVHFENILKASNNGLGNLPFEIFIKLLGSKSLNVISERSVWEAILSWTEANSSIRLSHVPALLTCFNLDEEVDGNLAAEILSHPIVSRNPHFFSFMLSDQLNFRTLQSAILSQLASLDPLYQNFPHSYGPRMPNNLYLIAWNTLSSKRHGSELYLSYDNEVDFGRRIAKPYSFVDMMLRVGQHIYMFEKKIMVEIFDIIEETWVDREIPPMPLDPDDYSWTVTLGEKLYHINYYGHLYVYKIQRNRWINKTAVSNFSFVYINGAAVLKDQIFIVGRSDEDEDNAEVMIYQAYDPEENIWISLAAPNVFREKFTLQAYHGQVLLIPVHIYGTLPKTIEVYDPNQNIWNSLPDLPFSYFSASTAIVDDKVFVYENNEKDRQYQTVVNPPVYWDDRGQIWRIVHKSSPWFHIERLSVLLLDDYRIIKEVTAKNRSQGMKWKRILPV